MSKYSSLTSLVLSILILWKSSCVPSIDPYELILLAQTSFRTWAGSRKIKPSLIVWISLFNLYTHGQNICFWYPLLEIIIALNLSVGLFRCSYHLMPSHEFSPWMSTDTHIRFLAVHRIIRWIIVWLALPILKPLSSPLDMNFHCRVISSPLTSVLYFFKRYPLLLLFIV